MRRDGTVNNSNQESSLDVTGPVLGATGDAWIASADAIPINTVPLTGGQATPGACIQIDIATMLSTAKSMLRGLEKVPGEAVDCGKIGVDDFCLRLVPASTRPFPVGGEPGQAASDRIVVYVVDGVHHDPFS